MRILVASPRLPWPARDGGQLGIALHFELLAAGHACRLVAGRSSRGLPETSAIPGGLLAAPPDFVDLDLPSPLVSFARSLPTAWPATLYRYRSERFARRVREIVREWKPDVAIAEHLHLAYLRRAVPEIPWLVVEHNVESLFLERVAHMHGFPKNALFQLEARRMRALEPKLLSDADAVISVDEEESEWIRAHAPRASVHVVPWGVPHRDEPRPDATSGFLVLGSWRWEPNREAAEWFVRSVWPRVRAKSKGARATIAGKDSGPAGLEPFAADVSWAGEVPEVAPYMRSARALVVPLLTGAGLRVKILEAMSYGTPVISTVAGAGSLTAVDGEHLLLARDAAGLAEAILALERDPDRARRIGEAGRAWVSERFGLRTVRERLEAAVAAAVARGRARLGKS